LLLVASCNGFVRALNKTTGALTWFYDSGQDGSGGAQFHGNPAVTKETVFIGSDRSPQYGGAYLYAFENHTGKLRWKRAVGAGTWVRYSSGRREPVSRDRRRRTPESRRCDRPRKLEDCERRFKR